jgi:hypothetical protein
MMQMQDHKNVGIMQNYRGDSYSENPVCFQFYAFLF